MSDRSDHHHHHHHHRHSDSSSDDDQPPPPFPPPSFHPPPHRPDFPPYDDRPPPPPHFSPYDQPPPPPPHFPPEQFSGGYQNPYPGAGSHYAPPPDPSYGHPHQDQDPDAGEERHHYRPHVPAFIESHIHGHDHQTDPGSGSASAPLDLSSKPSVKVYCQADPHHLLAIRDGKVILARSDPNDLTQHWVKDERYSTKVKDQDRYPSFALVNKATGQALKHSTGATHPVQLIAYNPEVLDESVLWTMGKDLGDEYRQIRMVNNTRLVFDAFNGDKKHGGVHDGTTVVLWEPGKGDNQRWQITPFCKS